MSTTEHPAESPATADAVHPIGTAGDVRHDVGRLGSLRPRIYVGTRVVARCTCARSHVGFQAADRCAAALADAHHIRLLGAASVYQQQ